MNETWVSHAGFRVEVISRGAFRQRWRFLVRAANGEIVATSEAYSRRIDAVTTAERILPRVEEP